MGVVALAALAIVGCGPRAGLAHFSSDALAFDYPASWSVLQHDLTARGYQTIHAVLGTGTWALNCYGGSNWGECGADDRFTVGPGQVVVEISSSTGPFPVAAESTDPRASPLPAGWPAYDVESSSRSTWWVYWGARGSALSIDAHFAEPGAEDARAAVRALVDSLKP
jgi:hypothetical protein